MRRGAFARVAHCGRMTASIAFVGAGPTTLYALHALLSQGDLPARITVIEAGGAAGSGSPYSAEWNDRAMLSNIASVEIPPVMETLADWLAARRPGELRALDIDPAALDERSFVPRLAMGRYFEDQFAAIVERARAGGVSIQVMTDCRAVDAANTPDGIELTYVSPPSLRASKAIFDHVVLATGHNGRHDSRAVRAITSVHGRPRRWPRSPRRTSESAVRP